MNFLFTGEFPEYAVNTIVLITFVFLLAGAVKGIVGLGLPTISMALLAIMMPPAQAAALLVIPSLLTNIWQMRPFCRLREQMGRIGTLQAGIFAGTVAGAVVFGAPAGAGAGVALGMALIVYACWGLRGRAMHIPEKTQRWLGPATGLVTGLITAATGVFVVPAVPYLQALGLSRDALIQAMGVSFTVSTVALALGLWINHSYSPGAAGISLLMLVPALIGMSVGQGIRQRLPLATFKKVFFFSLIALGIYQIVATA